MDGDCSRTKMYYKIDDEQSSYGHVTRNPHSTTMTHQRSKITSEAHQWGLHCNMIH